MMNEIAHLTNKNQKYEARLNQLETRGQQEQHAPPLPSSNAMKQRYYKNNEYENVYENNENNYNIKCPK